MLPSTSGKRTMPQVFYLLSFYNTFFTMPVRTSLTSGTTQFLSLTQNLNKLLDSNGLITEGRQYFR